MENKAKQVAVEPDAVQHGNWSLNQMGQVITKYDLEYLWIPNLVWRHNNKHNTDNIPLIALYDFKWWKEALSRSGEMKFSFDDLKFTTESLKDGRRVLFYIFPEADEPPLENMER